MYNALPGYQIGNQIDFSPVSNALSQVAKQNNANRAFGLEQQQVANQTRSTDAAVRNSGLQYEKNLSAMAAGPAQAALGLQDPNARAAIAKGIIGAHPEMAANLQRYGVDPNNPDGVLNFIVQQNRGYVAPEDLAYKKAQTSDLQSQAGYRAGQLGLLKRQMDVGQQMINDSNGSGQPAPQYHQTPDNKRWTIGPDGNYHEVD
jgi:hypothetical protein